MTGLELVVGYLIPWGVGKVRRVGQRADVEVDQVLDAGMDRLHELVAGNEPPRVFRRLGLVGPASG